jgi:hypothetical protein
MGATAIAKERLLHQRLRRGDRQSNSGSSTPRRAMASREATPGASFRICCARAATPGSPAATIPISISRTGAWRRPSPGCAPAAARSGGAALYTSSTLALNPDDRQAGWYFQHIPGESLDLDEVFERVLVDSAPESCLHHRQSRHSLEARSQNRKVSRIQETVFQNVFDDIDPKTGEPTYRNEILEQQTGKWVQSCPSTEGGHNWQAMSYNPARIADHSAQPELHGDVGPPRRFQGGRAARRRRRRFYEMPGPTATSASWPLTT